MMNHAEGGCGGAARASAQTERLAAGRPPRARRTELNHELNEKRSESALSSTVECAVGRGRW